MNGFARIKCTSCGAEKLLHSSCKTRGFCPSCQTRRAEEWSRCFAGDLSRAAHKAVAKFMELATGEGIVPAMVVVKHTCGEGVRFHPHLHTVVSAGGWRSCSCSTSARTASASVLSVGTVACGCPSARRPLVAVSETTLLNSRPYLGSQLP